MFDVSLVLADDSLDASCGACGEPSHWQKGPRLVRADSGGALCRSCTGKQAPQHLALLELVQVAERVGRHSRHLLTPSMKCLLELARAAEVFTHSADPPRSRAG